MYLHFDGSCPRKYKLCVERCMFSQAVNKPNEQKQLTALVCSLRNEPRTYL